MKPVRNPELEAIRESVLSEKVDHEGFANRLMAMCKNLHSSYLFHPEGMATLKALCTIMSSTPTTVHYSSWKDLAGFLGLTFPQIGCIENYKYEDNTEMVLKTFAQRKEATVDLIIEGLHKIQRFDVTSAIKNPLEGLVEFAKRQQAAKTEDPDIGYYSLTDASLYSEGILKPEGYHHLRYQLPVTLRTLMDTKEVTYNILPSPLIFTSTVREGESIQQSVQIDSHDRRPKCSKRVMLTFSKDGENIARELAKDFRKSRNGKLPIGVLILNDHPDKVNNNPERFIIHIFAKMDFVIPIVTEGYLEALGKSPEPGMSWGSTIDPQYVQLIHDLMSKYYVERCCRNDKFRCVIPDQQINKVLRHPHMRIDPVLKVFFRQSETNQLAERIISAKRTY